MSATPSASLAFLGLLVCLIPTAPGQSPVLRTDRFGDPLPPGALVRLGTIRWRTGSSFRTSSALTKDGRTLFVSDGESIRVVNLDTGQVARTIKGHEGQITCLALARR